MSYEPQSVDETAINTIRVLAADVVAGANSGHPGKLILVDLKRQRKGWPSNAL